MVKDSPSVGEGGEGGSHGHVGEVAEDASVDRAHGVVEVLAGGQLDPRLAFAEGHRPHAEERGDRRQLELSREPPFDELREPAHAVRRGLLGR